MHAREVIRTLLDLGCVGTRNKGDHRMFLSPDGETIAVPYHSRLSTGMVIKLQKIIKRLQASQVATAKKRQTTRPG